MEKTERVSSWWRRILKLMVNASVGSPGRQNPPTAQPMLMVFALGVQPPRVRWWDHSQLPVEPAVVEPIDIVQGGVLYVIQASPGTPVTDQFRLVEPVE
jgi:hypothetical protein